MTSLQWAYTSEACSSHAWWNYFYCQVVPSSIVTTSYMVTPLNSDSPLYQEFLQLQIPETIDYVILGAQDSDSWLVYCWYDLPSSSICVNSHAGSRHRCLLTILAGRLIPVQERSCGAFVTEKMELALTRNALRLRRAVRSCRRTWGVTLVRVLWDDRARIWQVRSVTMLWGTRKTLAWTCLG